MEKLTFISQKRAMITRVRALFCLSAGKHDSRYEGYDGHRVKEDLGARLGDDMRVATPARALHEDALHVGAVLLQGRKPANCNRFPVHAQLIRVQSKTRNQSSGPNQEQTGKRLKIASNSRISLRKMRISANGNGR